MTRQEKIGYILDELSLGEQDIVPSDITDMVEAKSDHCLSLLVNQIRTEKEWLTQVEKIA